MYFIQQFGGFNSTPKYVFNMFPQISGLENIAFAKGGYGDLAITINVVLFSLYWWLWIIIHYTNTLVKLCKIPSE